METLSSLDIQFIQAYLPHRYPFLLVDRILKIIPKQTIIAIKNVTINEPFFHGHFPGDPIMPGMLIVEAMAQAAGILAGYTDSPVVATVSHKYILAAIDRVKFIRPVLPGDQLQITASIQWQRASFVKFYAQATVDDTPVCTAEITEAKQPITANIQS